MWLGGAIADYNRGAIADYNLQKTKELIESVGCKVIFLPPYSPDLNPIEKFWANMKKWIKNKITETSKLFEAISMFFVT